MKKEYAKDYMIHDLKELKDPQKSILLLGSPVEHSISPIIHNAAFKYYDLDYRYFVFDVKPENLKKVVEKIRDFEVLGCNITIPHKVEIIKYLDEISKEADLIGAVNTILNKEGKLCGYNTDASGFYLSLKEADIKVENKKIAVLGAGGAAKSIAVKLALENAYKIDIYNRTKNKAKNLSNLISNISSSLSNYYDFKSINKNIMEEYDIVINTTPLGMYPDIDNVIIEPQEYFSTNTAVIDIIYNPLETKFLQKAKENGMKTLNGLGMLIYQGIEAFYIWTGKKVDKDLIQKVVEKEGIVENKSNITYIRFK